MQIVLFSTKNTQKRITSNNLFRKEFTQHTSNYCQYLDHIHQYKFSQIFSVDTSAAAQSCSKCENIQLIHQQPNAYEYTYGYWTYSESMNMYVYGYSAITNQQVLRSVAGKVPQPKVGIASFCIYVLCATMRSVVESSYKPLAQNRNSKQEPI